MSPSPSPSPSQPPAPTGITRIDHVGIACRDLDASIEFYQRVHGLTVEHEEVNEEQGVREVMLRTNGTDDGNASYLQLLEPTHSDSPVAKFLDKYGEGVHHVAFGTGNVDTAAHAAAGNGIRVLGSEPRPGTAGSRIVFLHPRDCGGVLTELVQAPEDTTGDRNH
ncbi:methylmalonyl-CoA epimerase [Lipingzhangella sp. LS1_29]|uniref:Methylmalonyl-CoA epimerase n=1 Tax=Lipingzhangella rawalii TaxID=2055835 RepID=A0ABU2H6L4_9ACTN|nr:methylmalonyl-CoA epimerase [Lipingzhangella rawalii]MDS1270489.1 methylmalonyl-CoA epimerase [Lipingzhangella rawalii]